MSISSHTFRAFRSRNYRLYFGGQSVSVIGTWMQRTAVSWVVYTLTHSALMLGLATFASGFPTFLLTLYGGIVSDRYNRHRVLFVTQIAALVQAALMAALVLGGHYTVWEILALSVVLGMINAFDLPARLPLVHDIIRDKDDLPNALAFNSSMNNMARLVGPALSGILLQHFGAGVCFLLNALSFVAVIASLLLMKLPPHTAQPVKKKVLTEMAEGFTYIKNTPSIGRIMLMLMLMSLLVLPYNTLFPVFAKVVFKGNAATFGYINSFIGLGALAGAYFLAALKPGADFKKILFINALILGVGLILFSRISWFPLAMACAVACGFGTMSQTSISNTIIQMESEKAMRGRVIGFLAMSVYGMLPLGSLMIGALSRRIGAPGSLLTQGCLALGIALVFSNFLIRNKKRHEHGTKESPSRHGHAVGVHQPVS